MRLGLCTALKNLDIAAQVGYDFIEPTVSGLAAESEESFKEYQKKVQDSPIKPESFCALLPGGMMLVGDQVKLLKVKEYLDVALCRVTALGGRKVVWGSGYARRCPDGFDKERAYGQLAEAGYLIGEQARKYGITITLEPLCPAETNMINTVTQGAELVRTINHDSIWLLADAYHMRNSGESFSVVAQEKELIRHIHIVDATADDPKVREYPTMEDKYGTSELITILKRIGYQGSVSLECVGRENFAQQIASAYEAVRTWMK